MRQIIIAWILRLIIVLKFGSCMLGETRHFQISKLRGALIK